MKLQLLYVDELRGFYKSKVMLFLWIGLPIVALLFRFVQVSTTGQAIPFTVISALVVSSLAGTLAAVMLTVSIINEKNRHVYELFLIRPLKRRDIMLSKFLSVYHMCCDCKSDSYLCGRSRRLLYLGCSLSHSLQRHSSILSHKPLHGCGGLLSRRI